MSKQLHSLELGKGAQTIASCMVTRAQTSHSPEPACKQKEGVARCLQHLSLVPRLPFLREEVWGETIILSSNMADQEGTSEAATTPTPEAMQTEECPTKPTASVDGDEARPEEERNLTDHLNKRLLESFLTRLDSGAMQFPQASSDQQEDDSREFEEP